jgi:excisionase family DNA binding protein
MAKTLTPTLEKKRTKVDSHRSQGHEQKLVSITEAAEISNVTRQAIYVAIKLKKLSAKKENTRWAIHLDDLDDYRKHRYSRTRSMFDGELLFDNMRGYYSVNQVADKLKVPAQKIYYATRAGHIRGARKGAAWVIHEDELKRYREQYLDKKFKKKAS